jgi:type IV pilus assembly protein PilE
MILRPFTAYSRSKQQGFTLIEVMITVAIIAILAMLAIPSYRDYLVRGQLTDATTGLSTMRAQMERYFQDNRTYASVGTFTTPCAAGADSTRTVGQFVISCSGTPDGTTFTLQAVGSGSTNGFTFKIDQSDTRSTTAAPTGYSTCATKWLLKKGASCS